MRRLSVLFALMAWPAPAAIFNAEPSNYQALLHNLKPGDTLNLAPGKYPPLNLTNLNGTPEEWIVITGPSEAPPAVIEGAPEHNTVEITDCSYVSIENLVIDSRGIPGAFGISARGHEHNQTHDIRIEGNTLIGQNGGQQTDGISTKTPTWGWVIRYNRILGAGTGLYLGDSDGTQPFVAGVIENNLVKDTIGYDMEIKDQHFIPAVPGMPLAPVSTIIRNNVFIKNDRPSEDGDRPNVLVGSLPETGAGALNMYEIYGNYFVHNHREALFQGSGRVSLHDNIFIDGPVAYPAVVLRKQNGPLKVALVYHNTIYTSGPGIHFGTPATDGGFVVGNLVFASQPISAPAALVSDNLAASMENAPAYVRSPSFEPSGADFYPLPGKCQGGPIDVTLFQSDVDYTLDFNGVPKTQAKGAVVYRGAYAGEGRNPGWALNASLKPPAPPLLKKPRLVWVEAAAAPARTLTEFTLTGANFDAQAAVKVTGTGVEVADTVVESGTQIKVRLKVAPGTAPATREVTVITSTGTSNAFKLRLGSGHRER